MPLINFEINFISTWSWTCVIIISDGEEKFAITNTKLYVPAETLSTKNKVKLLEHLKSGFKRTINWNKYQRKR